MKLTLLISFLLFFLCGFSQELEPKPVKEKFEFENYKNGRLRKIKSGSPIDVYLNAEDTIHIQYGGLLGLNDTILTLELWDEDLEIYSANSYYIESTSFYYTPKTIAIPASTIKYITYESRAASMSYGIAGLSLITAVIIAPLASIDRDEPHNFNTKRYSKIMKPALLGLGIGLTLSYTLDNQNFMIIPGSNRD